MGESPYKSPTDMGVNMAGNCIFDNDAVCEASRKEIVRRYYNALGNRKKGTSTMEEVLKIELIMKQAETSVECRACVKPALEKAELTGAPAAAIELPDGRVVTGKTSDLLGASAATILNALKALAGLDDDVYLISPEVIEPIQDLKTKNLGNHNPRLHIDETLIALAISATTNETAAKAFSMLESLRGTEAHSSVILSQIDDATFKKLGINLTCEPVYQTKKLYHA